jgi:hypothetical protein
MYIYPIKDDLKKGNDLLPLLLNLFSEYVIKKIQPNQMGLKFNRT